jgi:hypothetical protein
MYSKIEPRQTELVGLNTILSVPLSYVAVPVKLSGYRF